jgi:hypothetical protein
MTYFHDCHGNDVIIDHVKYAIVALSNAVLLIAAQLLNSARSWLFSQTVDTSQNPLDILLRNAAQVLRNRLLEENPTSLP